MNQKTEAKSETKSSQTEVKYHHQTNFFFLLIAMNKKKKNKKNNFISQPKNRNVI